MDAALQERSALVCALAAAAGASASLCLWARSGREDCAGEAPPLLGALVVARMEPCKIKAMIPVARREGIVTLGPGDPPKPLYPINGLRVSVTPYAGGERLLDVDGAALERALSYGNGLGQPEMVAWLTEHMRRQHAPRGEWARARARAPVGDLWCTGAACCRKAVHAFAGARGCTLGGTPQGPPPAVVGIGSIIAQEPVGIVRPRLKHHPNDDVICTYAHPAPYPEGIRSTRIR